MIKPLAFWSPQPVVPGSRPQTSYPKSDGSGSWTIEAGAGSNLFEQVDEGTADDATTFITSGRVTSQEDQVINCNSLSEPGLHDETKINVRYRRDGATTGQVQLKVYIDSTLYGTKNVDQDSDWHDWTITLTEAQSEALGWGSDFAVKLRKETSTYTRGIDVTQLNITTEQ